MRTLIIVFLNLALPFLLRALWLLFIQWRIKQHAKQGKPEPIDITPKKNFPLLPLLISGLLLLGFSLMVVRFTSGTTDTSWQPANNAQTVDY